jgi:large subunit ribosomal protein L31
MKKDIHPKYSQNVKVTCSCGSTFITGSVLEEITTELCSKCHPFYTGDLKIVDSENLVAKFQERQKKAVTLGSFKSKKDKMNARKDKFSTVKVSSGAPSLTLKDMLSQLSK